MATVPTPHTPRSTQPARSGLIAPLWVHDIEEGIADSAIRVSEQQHTMVAENPRRFLQLEGACQPGWRCPGREG